MRLETWREAFRTPGCPAPETILEAVCGRLGEDERRRLEEHCESCPACSAERLLAVQFAAGGDGVSDELFPLAQAPWRTGRMSLARSPRTRGPLRFPAAVASRLWVTRLAAGLLLAVGIGGLVALQRELDPVAPALPDPLVRQAQRSTAVDDVAPRGSLREAPGELTWSAVPGAARYRVRVLEVDDEVAWSGQSERAEIPVPEQVRAALRPGVPYRWQVEALATDGSVIARSDLVEVSILESTTARAAAEVQP